MSDAIGLNNHSGVTNVEPDHIHYAGFWIRTAAAFIDWSVLLIIMFLLVIRSKYLVLAWVLIYLVYFDLFWSSSWMGTPGMKALGIKIVDYSYNRISFAQARKRSHSEFLSRLLLIGYLMIAFSKRKQGLHDKIAKTLVIYSPRKTGTPGFQPQIKPDSVSVALSPPAPFTSISAKDVAVIAVEFLGVMLLVVVFGLLDNDPPVPVPNGQGLPAIALNYPDDVKNLLRRAIKGDADAQLQMGGMYENGSGVAKDYREAVKWYREAANQGNAAAQTNLGVMYRNGSGVNQDYDEAVKWYRKAADQGHSRAQNNLGWMYQNGWGVAKDYDEALKWYRKTAEQGNDNGQGNLGWMYQNGLGVAKDYGEALKWYRKAAEQGNAGSQNSLGLMYQNGWGVAKDYREALKWFQKAADQGDAPAQYNLGSMYGNGRGVPKNYGEALKWYRKAADQGNQKAKDALLKLK